MTTVLHRHASPTPSAYPLRCPASAGEILSLFSLAVVPSPLSRLSNLSRLQTYITIPAGLWHIWIDW